MQLTLHATRRTPYGASRLVQAVSAWSVKTRHAPSRHCRDARVDGHTTTVMHDIEYVSYRVHPPRAPWGPGGRMLPMVLKMEVTNNGYARRLELKQIQVRTAVQNAGLV